MARFRSTDEAYIRKITVRVLDDVHEALQTVARSKHMSMNQLLNRLITQYLAAQEAEPVEEWLRETGDRHRDNLLCIRRASPP